MFYYIMSRFYYKTRQLLQNEPIITTMILIFAGTNFRDFYFRKKNCISQVLIFAGSLFENLLNFRELSKKTSFFFNISQKYLSKYLSIRPPPHNFG